ncbi:CheW domain-containing protein [Alkalimarinus alittae]|uniref:Chemotaxis protein CheW n=1 Tax=Alkalimarinus alittae TaxID=2961619 RepID=A0ABY6MYL0_9ALTE|nr:CheW domain-containing protein [Alkalimarinus alittae]UZE94932.1 chemotaxis protein CheW [Alkalimarinus alittae]
MSRKRYTDTINPQIAVQDYLNDLLQAQPTTSPLDKLRQEEEDKALQAEADKNAQIFRKKEQDKLVQKPVIAAPSTQALSVRPQSSYTSVSAAYSAGRETSLAAQRLEKKRALGRASQRDFREPLSIKPLPLKVMPVVQSLEGSVVETTQAPASAPTISIKEKLEKTVTRPAATLAKHKPTEILQHPENLQSAERALTQPVETSVEIIEEVPPVSTEDQKSSGEWLENGRPQWAQGRFECLLFTVAGLKLAVPLVSLGAIHTIDQELTPLVGRPRWFLGLLPVGEKNIRVVDSALWIMPERYHEGVKDGYRFVIRLDNSEWGMACDSVAQSITISPEEVRWRTNRGKRPWLAGTVIDHMCALMDVAAVARLLDTAEKTNHSPI